MTQFSCDPLAEVKVEALENLKRKLDETQQARERRIAEWTKKQQDALLKTTQAEQQKIAAEGMADEAKWQAKVQDRLQQFEGRFQVGPDGMITIPKPAVKTVAAGAEKAGEKRILSYPEILEIARLARISPNNQALLDMMTAAVRKAQPRETVVEEMGTVRKAVNAAISTRTKAILSSPTMLLSNLTSLALYSPYRRLSNLGAAAISGNKRDFLVARADLRSAFRYMSQSIEAFKRAFVEGDSRLQSGISMLGDSKAWSDTNMFLRFFEAFPRLAQATDEGFKMSAYLRLVAAETEADLALKGIPENEWPRYIESAQKYAFDSEGQALRKDLLDRVSQFTFTQDIDNGIFAKPLSEAVSKTPELRAFLPVVRVPLNVYRASYDHTPLIGLMSQRAQEMWKAGGAARGRLVMNQAVGATLLATGFMLAEAGLMTGRGHKNPKLKRQEEEAGFKPNQLVLPGGMSISVNRFDPFFFPLAMGADLSRMRHEASEVDLEQMLSTYLLAFLTVGNEKSLLKNIDTYMRALTENEDQKIQALANTFIADVAASYVPSYLKADRWEETAREAQTVWDRIAAKLPGFSDEVEPRRNWAGEVVSKSTAFESDAANVVNRGFNPFTFNKLPEPDSIDAELLKIGQALPEPSRYIGKGASRIDMKDRDKYARRVGDRQSPWDRMWELAGTITIESPESGEPLTMRQRIEELVKSDAYREASAFDSRNIGGRRYEMVKKARDKYFEEAKRRVGEEYPSLTGAINEERQQYLDSKWSTEDDPTWNRYQAVLDRLKQ